MIVFFTNVIVIISMFAIVITTKNMFVTLFTQAILFCVLRLYNKKQKNSIEDKLFNLFQLLIYIYSSYMLIVSIMWGSMSILYNFGKIIPLLLVCEIIKYYIANYNEMDKIVKANIIIFTISIAVGLALYFFADISRIEVNANGLSIERKEFMIAKFNEERFSWIFGHKTRIATISFLMMYFTYIIGCFKKGIRLICYILGLLAIALSDAYTTTVVYISILLLLPYKKIIAFKTKKLNKKYLVGYYKFIISCMLIIIAFVGSVYIYQSISDTRDIFTLNNRTIIWESAFNNIRENKFGLGITSFDRFKVSAIYNFTNYMNAHNVILQEFVESGILGGILYISILLAAIILMFKVNKYSSLIFLSVVITSFMDLTLYGITPYIYWYLYGLTYVLLVKKKLQ